jgi:hypothetical protein
MKHTILFLFIFVMLFKVQSQQYDPTTKWPYLYENFTNGVIYFADNTKITANVNVHLLNSTLHYLKSELVFQIEPKDLIRVEIGSDYYIYIDNQLSRVIKQNNNNLLTSITKGDFDALLKSSGAYGMSANSSATRDLSSLEIGGLTNLNHREMIIEKEDGQSLPVKKEYFFIIDNYTLAVSKKNLEKQLNPEMKDKLKTYLKQNRFKWNDEKQLGELLDFLLEK